MFTLQGNDTSSNQERQGHLLEQRPVLFHKWPLDWISLDCAGVPCDVPGECMSKVKWRTLRKSLPLPRLSPPLCRRAA